MNDKGHRKTTREDLASLTRSRAMVALAGLLRRNDDVTFDMLAREAEIPVRTLYRHFETKEALFAAFWPWLNDRIEMPDRPRDPAALVAHIPALFAAFDRDEPLVRAMLHHPCGRDVRLAHAAERRAKFADALRDVTGGIPTPAAERLHAAVTALCSASGWETMKDNWGLSGPAVAEAAQWAVETLINDARAEAAAELSHASEQQ